VRGRELFAYAFRLAAPLDAARISRPSFPRTVSNMANRGTGRRRSRDRWRQGHHTGRGDRAHPWVTPSKVKLTVVRRGTPGATARRSLHLLARAAFKEKGAHEPRCLTAQAKGANLHLAPHNPCLRGSGVGREHAASSPADPQPAACPARREIEPDSSDRFASGGSAQDSRKSAIGCVGPATRASRHRAPD
jgi:hypothetical protein